MAKICCQALYQMSSLLISFSPHNNLRRWIFLLATHFQMKKPGLSVSQTGQAHPCPRVFELLFSLCWNECPLPALLVAGSFHGASLSSHVTSCLRLSLTCVSGLCLTYSVTFSTRSQNMYFSLKFSLSICVLMC